MGTGTTGLRAGPAAPAPPPEAPPTRRRLGPEALVAAATALATVVVLVRLGSRSLWFDEGVTIGLAREPFGDFVQRITDHEVNQSAYYVLFDGWHHLGEDVTTMRLLSAVFFVATVPLVFVVGRRLLDARVGAVAALLVSLHALAVGWGQQLRAYTLVMFLVTLATYLLLRAVEDPTPVRVLAYAVVGSVAVFAHFFAALVLLAHLGSLFLRRPFPRRVAAGSAVLVAAFSLPATLYVLGRQGDPLDWVVAPNLAGLVTRLGAVTGGTRIQLVAYGFAGLLGVAVLVGVVRRAPRSDEAWRAVLPLLWLAVPPILVILCTYTAKPLLVPSYLIVIVPAMAVVAAAGIVRFADRRVAGAAAVVLLVASVHGVVRYQREDGEEAWREATASVLADARPRDGLVAYPTHARPLVGYYVRHSDGPFLETIVPSIEDPAGPEVVWEVQRNAPGPSPLPDWDPLRTYDRWVAEYYEVAEERSFDRVVVRRLERR
jgi:mannosyltransferase